MSEPRTTTNPEPNHLAAANPERRASDEVIEVNRSTVYFVAIAILFFFVGLVVSNILFAASTGSLVADVKAAAATAAGQAVATGIAGVRGAVALAAPLPTATPYTVPHQAIDITGAPSWGPTDSKVTIVEFGDFQCPYCEYFFQNTYGLLKQHYGTLIHYVFRDFPEPQHPDAFPAALAAQCANEQGKFWEYHDMLYSHQVDLSSDALLNDAHQIGVDEKQFADCFKNRKYYDAVAAGITAGQSYKARGTPTFYINGEFFEGSLAFEPLAKYIDSLLNSKT